MGAQFRLRSLQQENMPFESPRKQSKTTRNANLKKRFQTEQMTVLSKIELSHHGKDQVELIYESYPVIQERITRTTRKTQPRLIVQSPQFKMLHQTSKTISFHQVKRMLQTYINQ
ncbi:unnamed protein product (macronuclear) [Paramecium tetraurelia]|uniref:Uncharacterized protein n=1 Tax=Paramecium tetraurelia TaxID=5888 RepID=A0C8X5_PARTE|nr:uncharacterized protein GSPATT00036377001 [Paramecium tetraurelia]CAK67242.1 unnamed protein product [Paramecium tetraurelia]|eukprot:XP_001434639.1 hypothetical protein (macronuclear) [Paramecium tetraurelia strain d4-2]